ncbi:MAG: membrane protein insertion efficiency factor YidD [Saprospiraceae bacterium]|nr:membrane protein insertion efficiency factor YidD [Saprospiraceae bacterium]
MIGKIIKKVFIFPIRIYQWTLSPLLGNNKCRYNPTCSHYAIEAIEEWGPIKGTYMGIQRILRCHPWSTRDMNDPVPKRKQP